MVLELQLAGVRYLEGGGGEGGWFRGEAISGVLENFFLGVVSRGVGY